MKVFHVLNHFLPQQIAGTEVYVRALVKCLMEAATVEEVKVVIPNYGSNKNNYYVYDGIPVIQYAEPSIADRLLIMDKRKPDGLDSFVNLLNSEKPAIVHFHEMAGSNGVSYHHVTAAKNSGAKVLMTFHLAANTCRTGTLLYKEKDFCNGVIDEHKCTACHLHSAGYGNLTPFLLPLSVFLYKMKIDTTNWDSRAGTALGGVFTTHLFQERFNTLVQHCDKVVVLTAWYKDVLLANGVPAGKIIYIPQALPYDAKPVITGTYKNGHSVKLVFLGRISPFKGLHLLIDALRFFSEEEISLDIYGQAQDKVYEEQCRHQTKEKKNIHWKGVLSQAEVVPALMQYDALCLCSTLSEMSPLVIQEAFAAGIPVIASNVYGNAEQIVHDQNG
ncbi:MAG: glycosyltransferase, partial [Sphingobacteriales bacterium]|nr:glycosyltransferase [Sphingobacteriales bacterium]